MKKIKGIILHPGLETVISDYFAAVSNYMVTEKVIELYNTNNKLIAFMIPSRFFHRFYGHLLTQYIFDYDFEWEDQAIPFLCEQIANYRVQDGLELIESYASTKKFTESLNDWNIVASSYAGDTALSKDLIKSHLHHELDKQKLKITEADHAKQIDRIMALKKLCFSKNKHLCWFWDCDQYQKQEYERLVKSLGRQETFLVQSQKDGIIVGYLGLHYDFQSVYWGASAGLDLLLEPDYQGKGLSYELYNFAFGELIKSGVNLYRGATANSSVLKVGKKMERWLIYDQLIHKDSKIGKR